MTNSVSYQKDFLQQGLQQFADLKFNSNTIHSLLHFLELLSKWNKVYNLTAIKNPREMVIRHIFDSLSLQKFLYGKRIIDVGTGAGLPGIPLGLINPDHEFALLDSNGKKARFLIQVVQELSLKNIEVINTRAEAFTPSQCFDSVISRAFAAIKMMIEQTQHLCCRGGRFLAMKGLYPKEELSALPHDIKVLGVYPVEVPYLSEQRHIVSLERTL